MLRSFANYVSVCLHSDFVFTPAEQQIAYTSGRSFLLNFQYVSVCAQREERCVWRVLPKSHAMDHTIDLVGTQKFNPY